MNHVTDSRPIIPNGIFIPEFNGIPGSLFVLLLWFGFGNTQSHVQCSKRWDYRPASTSVPHMEFPFL